MSYLKKLIEKEDGFSLVELTIAVAILAFVVAGLYNVLDVGLTMHKNTNDHAMIQMEARRNIERMTKELRQAINIEATGTNSITIVYDYNKDDVNDTIVYSYNPSTNSLYRTIGGTSREIGIYMINDTANPVFNYYDVAEDTLTASDALTMTKTRSIKVTIIVDNNTSSPPAAYKLENKVYLRNYD